MKKIVFIFLVIFCMGCINVTYSYEGEYTGTSFDTNSDGNADPYGITTDGSYFWVTDIIDLEIYKYNMTGTYQSKFAVSPVAGTVFLPTGVCTDGSNIWVAGYDIGGIINEYIVQKLQMDGTFVSSFNPLSDGCDEASYIDTDGSYIWIVDVANEDVYKYNMSGTYQSDFALHTDNTNAYGITTNGAFIYVLDVTDQALHKYTMDGTYRYAFELSNKLKDFKGIKEYDDFMYATASSADEVYEYDNISFTPTVQIMYQ